MLEWRLGTIETLVQGIRTDVSSAEHQLADHYEFAGGLDERIGGINGNLAIAEENIDLVSMQQSTFTAETAETLGALEQSINCVRYGLMEQGGFVRNTNLAADQARHMMMQERGNLVVWNVKNRSDCTDPLEEGPNDMEHAEEESPVSDMEVNPNNRPVGMERLLQNMRGDQNFALVQENWNDSNQNQQAIVLVLDSLAGDNPEGMSVRVVNGIRGVFQRLYRYHKNRGSDERRDRYRRYINDLDGMMH